MAKIQNGVKTGHSGLVEDSNLVSFPNEVHSHHMRRRRRQGSVRSKTGV